MEINFTDLSDKLNINKARYEEETIKLIKKIFSENFVVCFSSYFNRRDTTFSFTVINKKTRKILLKNITTNLRFDEYINVILTFSSKFFLIKGKNKDRYSDNPKILEDPVVQELKINNFARGITRNFLFPLVNLEIFKEAFLGNVFTLYFYFEGAEEFVSLSVYEKKDIEEFLLKNKEIQLLFELNE